MILIDDCQCTLQEGRDGRLVFLIANLYDSF